MKEKSKVKTANANSGFVFGRIDSKITMLSNNNKTRL